MPLEAAALLLDTVGLGAPLWAADRLGDRGLLELAHLVAGTKGGRHDGDHAGLGASPLIVAGGLWLCLWSRGPRLLGLVPIAIGASAAWRAGAGPAGDRRRRHLALVDGSGRPRLLRERSGDFVRSLISENSSASTASRLALPTSALALLARQLHRRHRRAGRSWRVLATRSGKSIDWRPLTQACARRRHRRLRPLAAARLRPQWLKLDRKALERTGGGWRSISATEPRVVTVADRVGRHPWRQRRLSLSLVARCQTASSMPPGWVIEVECRRPLGKAKIAFASCAVPPALVPDIEGGLEVVDADHLHYGAPAVRDGRACQASTAFPPNSPGRSR